MSELERLQREVMAWRWINRNGLRPERYQEQPSSPSNPSVRPEYVTVSGQQYRNVEFRSGSWQPAGVTRQPSPFFGFMGLSTGGGETYHDPLPPGAPTGSGMYSPPRIAPLYRFRWNQAAHWTVSHHTNESLIHYDLWTTLPQKVFDTSEEAVRALVYIIASGLWTPPEGSY